MVSDRHVTRLLAAGADGVGTGSGCGEQITYTYDALNRLASAVTSDNPNVTQWGQSYNYDGFGNLTDQNVIKGSAPTLHTTYNAATNRRTSDAADANGNINSNVYGGYVYDIENRLVGWYTGGVTTSSRRRPVWRSRPSRDL